MQDRCERNREDLRLGCTNACFRKMCICRVAEVSVYVSTTERGKGVGVQLLRKLVEDSEANNVWTLQAGIFPENIASIKIHEACGFRIVGRRERIGRMNNVWERYFVTGETK
jgi:L-amino acid N-acyltransferase YncA